LNNKADKVNKTPLCLIIHAEENYLMTIILKKRGKKSSIGFEIVPNDFVWEYPQAKYVSFLTKQ
jgi:hypothetical protein